MNEQQKSDFTNLLINTKAEIERIDKATIWQNTEPEWWIEMMDLQRDIKRLLDRKTTTIS